MNWETDVGPENLIEVGRASRGRIAAMLLVAFAAFILAMLPLAVALGSGLEDWVSPVLGSLAVILSGTKVVAALWGLVQGVHQT